MMKNCATCLNLHKKCDGECQRCGHSLEPELRSFSIEYKCKCDVCYDEDSGRYRYYEEDKEITKFLGGDEA